MESFNQNEERRCQEPVALDDSITTGSTCYISVSLSPQSPPSENSEVQSFR
jgi:hypothetical protein